MPSAASTVISISNPTEMTRGVICSEMESGGIWSSERRKHICQTLDWSYIVKLEMWANAQRDGRHVEYRWRPLFNAAKFG